MSEADQPGQSGRTGIEQLSHRRILIVMAVVVAAGAAASYLLVSRRFGFGFLFGGILSFVNYFWLKASLRKVFADTADGQPARVSAARYIMRYVTLGGIIGIVFLTHTVPVASVILGLTGFAAAVMIEAGIRLVEIVFNLRESQ